MVVPNIAKPNAVHCAALYPDSVAAAVSCALGFAPASRAVTRLATIVDIVNPNAVPIFMGE